MFQTTQGWWVVRVVICCSLFLIVFKISLEWVENDSDSRLLKILSLTRGPPPETLFGLHMTNRHLINGVRNAMIWPSVRPQPYNLKKPSNTYFSQKGQDEVVAKIFKNKKGGYFMEAGALNGERYSNTLFLERELGWTGLLVEPAPDSFEELLLKHRKSIALNACLAPTEIATELLLRKGNSVNALNNIVDKPQNSSHASTIKVPCFPFYTVLLAAGNPTIDFLSLDIEGPELKVLKTIPWDKVKIRLIGVEMNHIPEGEEALRQYLKDQGYTFYKMVEIDGYFYKDDLAADMLLD
uniref:Protein Star-like n=2 Tax=Hirondellea gigas TaxID=1518452 RepID=A0A2P2HWA2_9CRUS